MRIWYRPRNGWRRERKLRGLRRERWIYATRGEDVGFVMREFCGRRPRPWFASVGQCGTTSWRTERFWRRRDAKRWVEALER